VDATVCACATAAGGHSALLRLSGPRAVAVARAAGLPLADPWLISSAEWALAGGRCPCRVLLAPAPRSFTGCDLVEVTLPGSRDLVELALAALVAAGAEPAAPGAFTRQALANGRLGLDQAEAILALTNAGDAAAAARALACLRGELGRELGDVRERLLHLRALVEAGLDFIDEDDVRAYEPMTMKREIAALRAAIGRWISAATASEGPPLVCLAGPPNAGKSALFARLTGHPALVSAVPGTTRDALEETIELGGRAVRLADTAGWLGEEAHALDAAAIAAGRRLADAAALILACSAPDAPLPTNHGIAADRALVVATKSDLGAADPRAAVSVSVRSGDGLARLGRLVAERLSSAAAGEPRQQRLLARCDGLLAPLELALPADELLAEDLRRAADLLGELIGATTADDVLTTIFSRFCIGK
jgi:tRNA modification GTPase